MTRSTQSTCQLTVGGSTRTSRVEQSKSDSTVHKRGSRNSSRTTVADLVLQVFQVLRSSRMTVRVRVESRAKARGSVGVDSVHRLVQQPQSLSWTSLSPSSEPRNVPTFYQIFSDRAFMQRSPCNYPFDVPGPANLRCGRTKGHPSRHVCWCRALHDANANYTGRWESARARELKRENTRKNDDQKMGARTRPMSQVSVAIQGGASKPIWPDWTLSGGAPVTVTRPKWGDASSPASQLALGDEFS